VGALISIGCGSNKVDDVTTVNGTAPTGFVAGSVLDMSTGLPLPGARVQVFGAGISSDTMTDSSGNFQVGPVAAGASFTVHLSAANYADAVIHDQVIPSAAGNFPVSNGGAFVGPIGLLPTSGKFAVDVVSDSGAPVASAKVTIETAVRYFDQDVAKDTVLASANTDANGHAVVTGLPDVWSLPPRLLDDANLSIAVATMDGSLLGATVSISGATVKNGPGSTLVVLSKPGAIPLAIAASNVPRLVTGHAVTVPALLAPTDPIRVVFTLPVDHDSLFIDLRDESGSAAVATNPTLNMIGNILEIDHSAAFMTGQEYNLAIRAQTFTSNPQQILSAGSPLFAKPDPAQAIAATAVFVDVNGDALWGTAGDVVRVSFSVPIGRAGANPAFVARFWLSLDLDANMTIGDSTGELPASGPYPAPIVVNAAEPPPTNGAGLSGYTRFLAAIPIAGLTPPLNAGQGPVNFELQVLASDNGQPVTDAGGRSAPEKFTGAATLGH
jgi:hypothetical protein